MKQLIREFVLRINRERQVTVLLTTHDLRDIEELCSRVIILDKGKIIFDGSLDSLRAKSNDAAQLTFALSRSVESGWRPDALPVEGIVWKAENATLTAILGRHRSTADRKSSARCWTLRYGEGVQDIAIAEPQIEHIVQRIYAA